MPKTAAEKSAEEKQKYRWTNKLVTNVWTKPKGEEGRERLSHLLAGEWVKVLEEGPEESKVRIRGGEGYIDTAAMGESRVLELYFLDVEQGDGILIQTPDDRRVLVDAGKDESVYSFLYWKYHLSKYPLVIDAVILTHGDEDHAGGLVKILRDPNVIVKAIYHNGIAKYSDGSLGPTKGAGDNKMLTGLFTDPSTLNAGSLNSVYRDLVDAVKTSKATAAAHGVNQTYIRVDQSTPPLSIWGVSLTFLGPFNVGTPATPCLKCFGEESQTINGNSVAFRIDYRGARILLCGDMNAASETLMLKNVGAEPLKAHVFKANHHGSPDFNPAFIDAVRPWVSVVSSGDQPDYGHPRASLLGALGHGSPQSLGQPLLFSTEIAATFKPIPKNRIDKTGIQLYEKSLKGNIFIRTNGEWLVSGRLYGREFKKAIGRDIYKWEAYAHSVADGKTLGYNL
jgi:beta-lactamase superfamily II metal-dependent hydrolase